MSVVLSNLSLETLTAVAEARGYYCEKRKPSKEYFINLLLPDIIDEGARQFTKCLQVKELKVWTKKITKEVLTSRNKNNSKSASVLKKRLAEQIIAEGIEKFLTRLSPSESTLKTALERMGVEMKGTKEELKNALIAEIDAFGAEAFFNEFPIVTLKHLSEELKLDVATTSKPILVRCIVGMVDYTPQPRSRKTKGKKVASKKKKEDESDDDTDDDTEDEVERRKRIEREEEEVKKKCFRKLTKGINYSFSSEDEEEFKVSETDVESESIEDGDLVDLEERKENKTKKKVEEKDDR